MVRLEAGREAPSLDTLHRAAANAIGLELMSTSCQQGLCLRRQGVFAVLLGPHLGRKRGETL